MLQILRRKVSELLVNEQFRAKLTDRAKDFVRKNRGALKKIYTLIEELLESA